MTIICNTKETVTKIGHLNKINPMQIYQVSCQEQLNEALNIVAAEVEQEFDSYFQKYRTTIVEANYKVHIDLSKPSLVVGFP
eukprot:8932934-Ditylum_brightwellii.AAC.1